MLESSADSMAQVIMLRDLFRRTGALHEIQVQNLKIWPLLAFPMAATIATVDIEGHIVSFDLSIPKGKRLPKDVNARCRGLHESVQFLLGRDFQTRVLRGGKLIFTGRRAEPVKDTEYEGTDFAAGMIVPETPWRFKKTPKK